MANNARPRAAVFVVEDQEDVREVIAAHLDALGHQVVQSASGQAAAVRAMHPDLPIIITTGYADTTGFKDRIENAVLLRKPYRMSELEAAVEHALRHQGRHGRPPRVVLLWPAPQP